MSNLERFERIRGTTLGPSEPLTVDQGMIDRFAEATLDRQWIHVDSERARQESPFGTTVAHGMLTLSLIPRLAILLLDLEDELVINYGLDRVRFPAPLPAGERIRLSLEVVEVGEAGGGLRLTVNAKVQAEGSPKPVCVAQLLLQLA